MEWIKCSDRVPNKKQRVLVFIDFDSVKVSALIKDAEYTGATFRIGVNTVPPKRGKGDIGEPKVTHWMPLPEPPNE